MSLHDIVPLGPITRSNNAISLNDLNIERLLSLQMDHFKSELKDADLSQLQTVCKYYLSSAKGNAVELKARLIKHTK